MRNGCGLARLLARLLALTLALLAVVSPLALAPGQAAAAGEITLVINGALTKTDVPPMLVNGHTLVPLRVVSANLGAQVDWDQASQVATVTSGSLSIVIKVGDAQARVGDRTVTLAAPARLVSNRTMVPIRFVSESLGASVFWDQAKRQVTVDYGATGPAGDIGPAVEGLSWQETSGVARFVIITNGPRPYRVSTLAKNEQYPDRLLIDVADARLEIAAATPVGVAGVKQIRSFTQDLGGGSSRARIVFDTEEPVRYEVWATWDPSPPLGLSDLPATFEPGQTAIVVEIQYKVLGVEFVDEAGSERVVIHMNGPGDYRVWEASNPWRLVVDARRATLSKAMEAVSAAERTVEVGRMGITQVRNGQFNTDPDIARIVFDGPAAVAYNVIRDGNDIVVYLGGTVTITGFGYDRLDTGGRLTLWAGRPLRASLSRASGPERLILQFSGTRLGGQLAEGGTVSYGDDLVLDITYAEDKPSQTVTLTLGLRGPSAAEAKTTSDGLVLDIGRSALTGKKIVLDAGHGGSDPGAMVPGLREADLTPLIASKLTELLRAAGAEVTLTRETAADNPGKYERPELANAVGADALVSIHLNANDRSAICGSEVYFYYAQSRPLAEFILSRLLDGLGRPDGGVRWADFVVTREAHMPSCLVESLYMTNAADLAVLQQAGTLDAIARAIFEGLEDFFAAQKVS